MEISSACSASAAVSHLEAGFGLIFSRALRRLPALGELWFSLRAHTSCRPCCGGSSLVRCFRVMYFFRNMRRRGIEMIRADFELCKYWGGKQQRNESKRCHTSKIFEHSITLSLSRSDWWFGYVDRKNERGMHSESDSILRTGRRPR